MLPVRAYWPRRQGFCLRDSQRPLRATLPRGLRAVEQQLADAAASGNVPRLPSEPGSAMFIAHLSRHSSAGDSAMSIPLFLRRRSIRVEYTKAESETHGLDAQPHKEHE